MRPSDATAQQTLPLPPSQLPLIDESPHVSVKINGRTEVALIDSGSETSTISKSTAVSMALKPQPTTIKIRTITGQVIKPTGVVTAVFTIGNQTCTGPILVVDSSEDSVILGSNLINFNKRSFGYGSRKIDFDKIPASSFLTNCCEDDTAIAKDHHGRLYRLNCRDADQQRDIRHDDWRVKFYSHRDITVPARTAVYVKVRCNYQGAAVPVDIDAACGHANFPQLVTVPPQFCDTDSSIILVENWSSVPISFQRRQLIAEGVPLSIIRRLPSTAVSTLTFRIVVSEQFPASALGIRRSLSVDLLRQATNGSTNVRQQLTIPLSTKFTNI